ncbi:GM10860, partial [Drosophila sechellia]
DVKAEELELVQYHYYALKSTLEALSYRGSFPSLVSCLQFEKRRFLSLIIANVFQPIMVYQGNEDCDFINFYRETAEAIKFQDSMYENEEIQRRIDTILPILDAKVFFEAH